MPKVSKSRYKDGKGRIRWRRNDEVGAKIKQLGEYLIIGGYPEDHAKRYGQLAHSISRWPESVDDLAKNNALNSLPGVGGVITSYLDEIIKTGTTEKFNDDQYGPPPPLSVLELTQIDRLGAKTARMLYQDHGVDSLKALCKMAKSGDLNAIKGIGPKMIDTILAMCKEGKS
jgi:DNA polymerase (family 10)